MGKIMAKVAEALAAIGMAPHEGRERDAAGQAEARLAGTGLDGFAPSLCTGTGRPTPAREPGKEAGACGYEEFDALGYLVNRCRSGAFWVSVNERYPMGMDAADLAAALKPELYAMEMARLAELFPDGPD